MKIFTKTKNVPDKQTYFKSELTRRLVPTRMQFNIHDIVQSDFLRRVIIIKNFPSILVGNCSLARIAQMKNTTFSMWIRPMKKGASKNLIDNQIKNIKAKSHKNNATEQIEAQVEAESIEQFYTELKRSNGRIYYVNIYIEVYGKTQKELEAKCDDVISELSGLGITTEQLSYEQREGFLSVYPLGEDKFKAAANNMPSNTLASLYPLSYSSKNDPHGMKIGHTLDGGNVFIDLWKRDDSHTNGNFAIIGESGQGKSWLMKKIISQQIAMGTNCFILDPNGEYNDLIRKLGGSIVNLANGKTLINPFEIRSFRSDNVLFDDGEKSEIEAFNIRAEFYQHLSWLKDFYKVLLPAMDDKTLTAAMLVTKDMYINSNIDEHTDIRTLKSTDYPTFTTLYEYISEIYNDSDLRKQYPMLTNEMLQNLLLYFKEPYDGSLGFIFNGTTNVKNANIINYDISELLQGSKERSEAALFNTMTYVWNRITRRENQTMFTVDELYLLVNRNNLTIANYLKEFMKQARKYEGVIGEATQNIGDFLDPLIEHISAPLFNNPTYKFIFYPSDLDLGKVKDLLRLTDGEVSCIKTPHKGRCLLRAGGEDYHIQVDKLPYEDKLFGKAGGR